MNLIMLNIISFYFFLVPGLFSVMKLFLIIGCAEGYSKDRKFLFTSLYSFIACKKILTQLFKKLGNPGFDVALNNIPTRLFSPQN